MDNQDNNTKKPETKKKNQVVMALGPDMGEQLEKAGYKQDDPNSPLIYAISQANGSVVKKAPSLAFTENPSQSDNYTAIYKHKRNLLPDEVIKMIRVADHLIAGILRARGAHLSLFGHLQKDRFDTGLKIAIRPEFYKVLTPEQFEKITARIKRAEQLILNCGHTEGMEQHERLTLAEWFDQQARNGLAFGRFADEIIYERNGENKTFHRWRPRDVGTIARATRKGESVSDKMRENALKQIEALTADKSTIDLTKLDEDEYAWIQVVDGIPKSAFTHDEMLVFNLFPSTDLEHAGYPVTPLDTVISSVTTHISIDAYKKLYFQNGRATRGMLVIQSDEVDQPILDGIKAQFNASINNVGNSFRTPIFGMGTDDTVTWVSMAGEGAQDRDFQFMYDQVARNILSAFSISPDELPGYSHLSRGTNSQTLSESNNEFKLTAARDTGLRPLILKFQTYLNQRLFPIVDPILSQICEITLAGLDAQSKEQESTRLQQDSATHMTMDEILHEVGKDPIGTSFGGKILFNERWQVVADKYLDVGTVMARFFGSPGAGVDPMLRYKRDPFFLQNLQLLSEINPAAVQALYAPRPFALDALKMNVQDIIDDDSND